MRETSTPRARVSSRNASVRWETVATTGRPDSNCMSMALMIATNSRGASRPRRWIARSSRAVMRKPTVSITGRSSSHLVTRPGYYGESRTRVASRGCAESLRHNGASRSQERRNGCGNGDLPLDGSTHERGEDVLGLDTPCGSIAATHFPHRDGGADRLLGAPIGRVDGRVVEKRKEVRKLAVEMSREALHGRHASRRL